MQNYFKEYTEEKEQRIVYENMFKMEQVAHNLSREEIFIKNQLLTEANKIITDLLKEKADNNLMSKVDIEDMITKIVKKVIDEQSKPKAETSENGKSRIRY